MKAEEMTASAEAELTAQTMQAMKEAAAGSGKRVRNVFLNHQMQGSVNISGLACSTIRVLIRGQNRAKSGGTSLHATIFFLS